MSLNDADSLREFAFNMHVLGECQDMSECPFCDEQRAMHEMEEILQEGEASHEQN